jgi:hypothetical protein
MGDILWYPRSTDRVRQRREEPSYNSKRTEYIYERGTEKEVMQGGEKRGRGGEKGGRGTEREREEKGSLREGEEGEEWEWGGGGERET